MNVDKNISIQYKKLKPIIEDRIQTFKRNLKDKTKICHELCFCLCTPQSKALSADKAIKDLINSKLLKTGSAYQVSQSLKKHGVRFHNKKARYLIETRKKILHNPDFFNKIIHTCPQEIREWLIENIKGLGLKEASHFLRNIGLGNNLAILDRHILKIMKYLGIIDNKTNNLSEKNYYHIEKQLKNYSLKKNIPLQHLDLLFWSLETGFVFK